METGRETENTDVMGEEFGELKKEYAKKIREKGNENLADIIKGSIPSKMTQEGFIEGQKTAFPECKDELEDLHERVKELQKDGSEAYNWRDYFYKNNRGQLKFSAEKLGEEINKDYEFKYVVEEDADTLYVYQDGIYEPYGTSKVKDEVRKRLKGSDQWTPRKANKVVEYIKTNNQIKKQEFKPPRDKIPFKNGVYDTTESEFVDYRPEFNFTFKYEAKYRPDLDNDKVDEFLHTIQDNDDDVKKLKEITGLAMLPDIPIDKAPILFGKGANGKNQYVKINKRILGEDNWHELNNTDISKDKHATAELEGKQLVFYDEFEDVESPGKLKHLIGAENMRVRPMRKEGYTIVNTAYPIFAANTLPKTDDQTKGFFRRWEIIEFPFQFTKDDDHHKDLIPERELEEKYMSQEAIDAYATEAVQHLEDVLEDSKLTNEQNTDEVRQRWNERSNPIYSFIDKFIAQGEIAESGDTFTTDYVLKDDLKAIINKYLDFLNSGEVRKHEITHALENHADLEVKPQFRPQLEDGSRPSAYGGIQFNLSDVVDDKGKSVVTTQARARGYNESMPGKYHVITDIQILRNALDYLDSTDDGSATIFEMTKALDLSKEEYAIIRSSDFIKMEQSDTEGTKWPVFKIDEEEVATVLKEKDVQIEEIQDQVVVTRPSDWLAEEVASWSNETVREYEGVVQDGMDEGFNEENIEYEIEKLKDDAILYEPQPGKLTKV